MTTLFHCPELVDDRDAAEVEMLAVEASAALRTSRLGGTEGEDEESNSDSSSESVSSDEEEAEWHNARDHFSQTPFLGFDDDLHAHHEVEARLDKRLKKNDCCMVLVKPDNQSIYMALTEALRRRNSANSWMNVKREIWTYMKEIGDHEVRPGQTFKAWVHRTDWDTFVRDGARATAFTRFKSFAPAVLMAAAALYKLTITVVSGVESIPEMRFFPPHSWDIRMEKSPVTLGHVGGEVFVAVQTMTASIRAQLRQKKDQKRVQREDEKLRREKEEEAEEWQESLESGESSAKLAIEEKLKKELIRDLMRVAPGVKRNTVEMVRDERVEQQLERMDMDDMFEMLFETKCIFDLFDNDSRGSVSLSHMEYAFQAFGLDLADKRPVAEGGIGHKTHDALRRQFSGGNTDLTLASFTKMLIDNKKPVDREISNLLEQLDIHEDEDGEYVMLDDLNEVLRELGADMEGLEMLDQIAKADVDPKNRPSGLLDNKIRIDELKQIGQGV